MTLSLPQSVPDREHRPCVWEIPWPFNVELLEPHLRPEDAKPHLRGLFSADFVHEPLAAMWEERGACLGRYSRTQPMVARMPVLTINGGAVPTFSMTIEFDR